MWNYWWILLIVARAAFTAGAVTWLNTATALTWVVSPSGNWLDRESRYNTFGIYLMTAGAVLALSGVVLAIGKWLMA